MMIDTNSQSSHCTVMLADDNAIDNFTNQKIIQCCNFAGKILEYTSTKNALEYLHCLQKHKIHDTHLVPAFIFLDINMPMMDGFQFIEEFDKLNDKIKEHCKIVILTSSLNPEDAEKAQKNKNVVGYLIKPLTKKHFKGLNRQHFYFSDL